MNQDFDQMRRAMVSSQLRPNAVNEPRVVAAMADVPRERYVPAERCAMAYADRLVPIGGGRFLNTPMATGRLLSEARPLPIDRVLVVGAATGYTAAVLAQLGASVVALEEDAALTPVREAGVTPVSGPLAEGWAEAAPYDLIVIDGVVEFVPQALIDQLADGGRLATAIVERGVTRLAIGRKSGAGFGMVSFADAEAAPLPGFSKPPEFVF